MRALPGVDTVQVDSAWVKRLAALLGVLRLALLLLAVTLGVVVIAVVFNTIRLQVLTQREEIAVSKLLGATDNFIHRPFYYTGALLGLCAGAVALGAVALALRPLERRDRRVRAPVRVGIPAAPLPPLGVAGCWPSAPGWAGRGHAVGAAAPGAPELSKQIKNG
jgi:cell division transport system permease protein